MAGSLNLIKLSVGTESVESLEAWHQTQRQRNAAAGHGDIITHTTRMWPRRDEELLAGGSIYWVIQGVVLARQPIAGLQERRGEDGIRRCAIVLEPGLIRTVPQPRRPFQGWRYLKAEDAPADLEAPQAGEDPLPHELASALAGLGVL
ncbi:DUF1489 family protein [Algicella marina]|uniref:DUF1489 family protein n=1 Tax=Algicella marina TaxID=2683284 RepID=A0A6P1T7B0_9RHOB|nr:DUF1489 domain-containing protein [Algicella marina]QHQ37386.1 DUF1489 family protein [Algicella marina]